MLEARKIEQSLEVGVGEESESQAKNVKKGVEVAKSDDFKSTAFFKKLQEEATMAVDDIKAKMIETKKKVGGESASYKL